VKVVTEAGTVYLMGIVTRKEADDATEIARTTSGVQKVVRVFEYQN
jgi:osmotically-inducible protein OsmY